METEANVDCTQTKTMSPFLRLVVVECRSTSSALVLKNMTATRQGGELFW